MSTLRAETYFTWRPGDLVPVDGPQNEVLKSNSNHDDLGRFASADGTIELGGSLNIPREEMPQLGNHTDDYLQWLKREKGIGSSRETVAPSSLKPSQGTVNTHLMGENPGGDPPVIISKDSYILNGHHRWYKALMQDKPLEAIRVDTPMKSLLEVSHEYPRVEYHTISHSRAIAGKVRKDGPPDEERDASGKWANSPAALALTPAHPDKEQWPEHIKALKPPPGLEHVRYSMDPKADLQIVGIFPKSGQPKYIYSKEYEAGQQAAKYARTVELDSKWNDVHAQNDDMRKSPDPLIQEHAECAHVVMHTGIRPGSEADAHGKDASYGATTLEGRHVVPHADGSVYLRFKGKAGVKINIPVEDKTAADILTRRAQAAGKDGQLFPNVTENSLLDHVHGFDGGGFLSKDLRTLLVDGSGGG